MASQATRTRVAALAIAVLCASPAVSAPSPEISRLMQTPATAFDVFLHRLYIASNGISFFGGPNRSQELRMFQLDYDWDSNIIEMKFHIDRSSPQLTGFASAEPLAKQRILISASKALARSLGLDYLDEDKKIRLGLIQMTPIRTGWQNSDLDETKVKEEVVKRTQLELYYSDEPATVYRVLRRPNGSYEFTTTPKSIPK